MDCNSRLCKIYTADSGYLQSILKILFVHDITQIGNTVNKFDKQGKYWSPLVVGECDVKDLIFSQVSAY